MKAKSILFVVFIFFLVSSCNYIFPEKQLIKKWDFSEQNIILEGMDTKILPIQISTNNSYIRFYDDGTFTSLKSGKFSYGKWTFNKDTLDIQSYNSQNLKSYVPMLDKENLILAGENFIQNDLLTGKFMIRLSSDNYDMDEEDEPFRIEKNLWRLRPTQKENFQQIKARAKSHLAYLVAFHKYALSKNAGKISFNDLVSPLQFINNGIFFHKEDTDDNYYLKWLLTFYDNGDAQMCRKLLKKTMYKTKLHNEIPDTISYNLDILEQMLVNIDLISEDKLK